MKAAEGGGSRGGGGGGGKRPGTSGGNGLVGARTWKFMNTGAIVAAALGKANGGVILDDSLSFYIFIYFFLSLSVLLLF